MADLKQLGSGMAQKVLIVDDVSMFIELEKSYLLRTAVTVLTARNGREALTICQAERPALVYMDLHMPVMDGAECCKAIKQDPQLKSTAVVLITAEGKAADQAICQEAGCDDFLTKPLDRSAFLEAARKLIPGIDRREKRIACRFNLKFRAFGITLSGTTADISRNGLYLVSDLNMEKDVEIDLIFALPEPVGSIIQTKARVAWLNTRKERNKPSLPEGFGIEFVGLSREAAHDLSRFLEQDRKVT